MAATKPVARIEDWTVVEGDEGSCLIGRVFDHPQIPDGHWAMTTMIEILAMLEAESRNTLYRLGKRAAIAIDWLSVEYRWCSVETRRYWAVLTGRAVTLGLTFGGIALLQAWSDKLAR